MMKRLLLSVLVALTTLFANAQDSFSGPVQLRRMTLTSASASSEVLRVGQVLCIINADPTTTGHNRIYIGNGSSTVAQLVTAGRYVMPRAELLPPDTIDMGNILWVSETGNDGTGERGNPAKPYLTVQAAHDDASDGDQINIVGDMYHTELVCSKILLVNGQFSTIENVSIEGGTALLYVRSIDGITIDEDSYGAMYNTDAGTVTNNGNWGIIGGTTGTYTGSGGVDARNANFNSMTMTSGGIGVFSLYNATVSTDVTIYESTPSLYIDRVTIRGGIVNAAFSTLAMEAYNTVTGDDTAGMDLDVTGYGNCFGCTDGAGGGTPTLAEVVTEGNNAGNTIAIPIPYGIQLVGSTYSGTFYRDEELTDFRDWYPPDASGTFALESYVDTAEAHANNYTDSVVAAIPAQAFTDLTDVPASYTDFKDYVVSVTPGEDGLEFEYMVDPDGTLAEDVNGRIPTQKAVKTYVDGVAATIPVSGSGGYQPYDADLDDLADGSLTGSKVGSASTSAVGVVELATDGENASGVVVQGNDSRINREQITTVGSGQTTTSTTPVTITGASVTLAASTTYDIELMVLAECSSTSGGFGLTLNGSAGATYVGARFDGLQSAGNYPIANISAYDGGTAATTCPAANTVYYMVLRGRVVNGGSSSTLSGRIFRGGGSGTITIRSATIVATQR